MLAAATARPPLAGYFSHPGVHPASRAAITAGRKDLRCVQCAKQRRSVPQACTELGGSHPERVDTRSASPAAECGGTARPSAGSKRRVRERRDAGGGGLGLFGHDELSEARMRTVHFKAGGGLPEAGS